MGRQVDGGIHLALACMYTVYKSWGKYPQEIAHIMQEILDLDRRKFEDEEGGRRNEKGTDNLR